MSTTTTIQLPTIFVESILFQVKCNLDIDPSHLDQLVLACTTQQGCATCKNWARNRNFPNRFGACLKLSNSKRFETHENFMCSLYTANESKDVEACAPDNAHYLIMSPYFAGHIGCTVGETGRVDVLTEEPGVTFKEINRATCPVCQADQPEPDAQLFVPPCTCRPIPIDEGKYYLIGGEDDCPVHGYGSEDEVDEEEKNNG